MGSSSSKSQMSSETRLILTQSTKYSNEELDKIYKIVTRGTKGDAAVRTNVQFFEIAEPLGLFEILRNLKFFDLTPDVRRLKSTASFRVASASTVMSNNSLTSPSALEDPEVKRYWSDMFFTIFDTDKDGLVGFQELVLGLHYIQAASTLSKAEYLFQIIDKSNTGKISLDQLFELHDLLFRGFRAAFLLTVREQLMTQPKLSNLSQEDISDLMRVVEKRIDRLEIPRRLSEQALSAADQDRDGLISFDEYYLFVTDVKTRKECEKVALEQVAPLLDNLLTETVDLIKQRFSRMLNPPPPSSARSNPNA